jgi:hypothetical protein
MTERLAPLEADRLQRAERRWLEQARERLHRPTRRTRPETFPETFPETEENDR